MFKLSQILIRTTRCKSIPSSIRFNQFSSSPTVAESRHASLQLENEQDENASRISRGSTTARGTTQAHSNMVAAAFASLHSDGNNIHIQTPFTDDRIQKAKTIDDLLMISEGNGVSRRHALKVVSVLADWSTSGKVKLSDFESDPRFIRLCRILTKGSIIPKQRENNLASRSEDLTTILSVTADDEAAKLVASITLPQMVKVMSTLSQKKRRSTLLLRALAYNITASGDKLDLKQNADLLFSMSVLSFPDENLLIRITSDVCSGLEGDVKKSAVVGSIITSIGLLKYKNPEILDALSEWILKNHSLCRPQDIFSLFMTLAVLNYCPSNAEKLYEVLVPQLTLSEAGKPLTWLEIVWSLVLLNQATEEHISSVLSESFIETLNENNTLNPSIKLKLLNIDGAAQYLIKNYQGPRINTNSNVRNLTMTRTKEKNAMVAAVVDSLKNLIQNENCLRTNVNSGLGFLVDAECLLGKKCNPLPLTSNNKNEATKVSILALDYHDMCRGRIQPTGVNILAKSLLEAKGYKVLTVPYTEFKTRDKVVTRVHYLESKLKEAFI